MNDFSPTPPADLTANARTLDLTAFGVPMRLELGGCGRDELVDHVLRTWSRCAVREVTGHSAAHSGPQLVAWLDPDRVVQKRVWSAGGVAGETLEIVSGALVSAVTYKAIEAARGRLLMVHAAAVADAESGRTAVLVAPSGTGKTTAARVLGQKFAYVTDETVALTPELNLLAYPKPLSLFPQGRDWGKQQHSPDDFPLVVAPAELALGPIFLLKRVSGASQAPRLRPLETAEAIAMLAEHISYAGELEKPLHRIAELVGAASSVHEVTYAEAGDLAAVVEHHLAAPSRAPVPEGLPHPPLSELGYDVPPCGTEFARLPLIDLYADDFGGAAMRPDGGVIVLSALAARAMTLIGDGTTNMAELSAALTDEFGVPPQSTTSDGPPMSPEERALRLTDDVVSDLNASSLVAHLASAGNDNSPPDSPRLS